MHLGGLQNRRLRINFLELRWTRGGAASDLKVLSWAVFHGSLFVHSSQNQLVNQTYQNYWLASSPKTRLKNHFFWGLTCKQGLRSVHSSRVKVFCKCTESREASFFPCLSPSTALTLQCPTGYWSSPLQIFYAYLAKR